ncbi:MAG: hypothetical protein ACJA2S_002444 [Cyclobacteriaceae bacterium]|jgi:hypothetical protein
MNYRKYNNAQSPKIIGVFLMSFLLISMISIGQDRDIYQIKIYNLDSDQQEQRMDKFLKDAFIPALDRAGIKNVGILKPNEQNEIVSNQIYVLIPFKSIGQFEKLEGILLKDKTYQADGSDYIDAAYDNPPYVRTESILLRAFKSMANYGVPTHSTPASEQVYELRSYQGATEKLYQKKVEMFTDAGESQIFVDLGFQPVFFGEVISGSTMPNLMYLTTFKNKKSQDEHWDAFRTAPAWLKLKVDKQYDNTVSKNVKLYLQPTDYSGL